MSPASVIIGIVATGTIAGGYLAYRMHRNMESLEATLGRLERTLVELGSVLASDNRGGGSSS